ncbi:tryptase beta-2 [Trichonephila inaurata madagascariensis]|uniref:Tryptase beta-2 n=1 Tax=Trichonephila inaurata madagascariensis TaxID=2747483 RepID=A0A8X7C8X2_9ARAC|nr:tryptase beta-2 [Trichonephila inaurata madagascariensis]
MTLNNGGGSISRPRKIKEAGRLKAWHNLNTEPRLLTPLFFKGLSFRSRRAESFPGVGDILAMFGFPTNRPSFIDAKVKAGQLARMGFEPEPVAWIDSFKNGKCKGQKIRKKCYYNTNNVSIKLLGKKKLGKEVKVKKLIPHPKFDNMKIVNDIALLKLEKPLKCGKTTTTICLPTNKKVYKNGQKLIIAGWGKTSDKEPDDREECILREGV